MDLIVTGIVRTSHGVRGYMKVKSLSGEGAHFKKLETVFLRKGRKTLEFQVETVTLHKDTPLLKLKGMDTPEEVKKYTGWEICVTENAACPLKEGEFYNRDLVGCEIFHSGQKVGVLIEVYEMPTADMFEIEAEGKKYLVPFSEAVIGDVNITDKKVELLNLEYLQ